MFEMNNNDDNDYGNENGNAAVSLCSKVLPSFQFSVGASLCVRQNKKEKYFIH